MDENLLQFGLKAFVTLMVVVDRIVTRFGEGKVHIITRVLGIVLAALAVQYVLNGLTGYYYSLVGRSA